MSNTTAKPEYCPECGLTLGAYRTLVPPEYRPVHPDCVDKWKARRAKADKAWADTSNTGGSNG